MTRSPCSSSELVDHLQAVHDALDPERGITIPSRLVHLPIAFDDSQTKAAVERYVHSIRTDAPNAEGGTNIDYVVRYNGLRDRDELYETALATEHWTAFIGFFPGLPFMFPLDPRDAIFVPKYNPTRTWTPEGAVGIGGPCYAIYPVESAGGYQLIGRSAADLRRPRTQRGLPREPAAAPRRRPRQVPPGRPRTSSCSSSRTSTPTPTATGSTTRPSTSARSSSGRPASRTRRRSGDDGGRRPPRRRQFHEVGRDHRGRASRRRSRTTRAAAGCRRRASSRPARWTTSRTGRRTCSSATLRRLRPSRSRSATSARGSTTDATIAVCGAEAAVTVDGDEVAVWESHRVPAGAELAIGIAPAAGFRFYLADRRRLRRAAALRLPRDVHDGRARRVGRAGRCSRATGFRWATAEETAGGAGSRQLRARSTRASGRCGRCAARRRRRTT